MDAIVNLILLLLVLTVQSFGLRAASADSAPVVSNVEAVQRAGTFLVDVTYDLDDAESAFRIASDRRQSMKAQIRFSDD